MSSLVWPHAILPPSDFTWSVDGAVEEGGQPIEGAPQTAEISGGGSWMYEHQLGTLRTAQQVGVYRALLNRLYVGKATIVVPVIDALQPWPAGLDDDDLVGWGDGSDFSDGSAWAADNPIEASLAADAYMPAWPTTPAPPNQAQIALTAGAALQGVEYFSVTGPSGAKRLHQIHAILDVSGDVYTVYFNPPLREDMAAGTVVDFNQPGCTMKLDLASAREAWPKMQVPFTARPVIRFREGGFVTPS